MKSIWPHITSVLPHCALSSLSVRDDSEDRVEINLEHEDGEAEASETQTSMNEDCSKGY